LDAKVIELKSKGAAMKWAVQNEGAAYREALAKGELKNF
jgi:hypothetical protein